MPSVRVKRSDAYTRIRDVIDNTDAYDLSEHSPRSSRARSGTLASIVRSNADTLRPDTFGRRRSRNSSIDVQPSRSDAQSQRSVEPPAGYLASQAPQMELLIPTHPQPGLVGSALHLPDSNSGRARSESFIDEHHEDDIVEHLEAIDPEIATVSNLSNAANSILIPPLNFYSRRPIITLPRRPEVEILTDTEAANPNRDHSEYNELDEHVEDVLHKKDRLRRTLRGVWSFIKTPQGAITALYGFLVAFWGAAIVFFLGRLINLHNPNKQKFWIEVCSQVENGLFTVTGVGFIPWRVLDTYRILKIWRSKCRTRKLRKVAGLPPLVDEDDLPDPAYDPNYVHVLTDKEQNELHYQQQQFQKSQTWYRPHGTSTHKAFPINTALLICLLIDGNSFFQCILCGCMWGLNRFQRPAWTTGTLIPASFLCGIAAAIFIWRGGHQTRRTQEVEARLKAALEFEKHTGVPAGIAIATTAGCSPTQKLSSKGNSAEGDSHCKDVELQSSKQLPSSPSPK